ncbi:MAG: 2-dehydropantoate 2-reductase [Paludibacter sp.]|nr:2-dehydropantoate 2-reductase [Paludibacter sp.]
MKIKILIVGLGGVGGYYGGLLAKYCKNIPEIEIYFFARGKHLETIKKNGLTVIAETETFVVHPKLATNDVAELGKMHYVILTTKSYDLIQTLDQISACIDNNTIILPLLNGADISERIRTHFPLNQVWDGCVYIVGRLNEPGIVESSGGLHDLYFGAEKGSNEKLVWMDNLFKNAGIESHLEENIKKIIWRKFMFISVTASLTSYFNVGFRDLLTDDHRKMLTLSCFNELLNIAHSEGVDFEPDIIESTIRKIERLPFKTTSSMHSDFIAGKTTEIDTLTKVVINIGKKNGVETPTYKVIFQSLNERLNNYTNGAN